MTSKCTCAEVVEREVRRQGKRERDEGGGGKRGDKWILKQKGKGDGVSMSSMLEQWLELFGRQRDFRVVGSHFGG